MVVERLHGELAVDVDRALGADGVAQRVAVGVVGAALPGVVARIGAVGRDPVEDGDAVDGKLVGERHLLAVGQGAAELAQGDLDAVLPALVVVGIEVGVDGFDLLGALNLGLSGALEGEVECLEDVPLEGERAVPQEGGGEGDGDAGGVLQVVEVALLQLPIGA